MRRLIPSAVIEIVAEQTANWETHEKLNSLYKYAGALGDPPPGSKVTKALEWLRRTNKDESLDPFKILGKIIEGYMEFVVDPGDTVGQSKTERKDKIQNALASCDLQYVKGGIVTGSTGVASRTLELETSVGVTWNSARRHLIALWKHAESIHLVSHNPWRELRAAQVRSRPKTILDSEFEKAKVYLDEHPIRFKPFRFWQCVFLTFACTGMRRAQLVGLIWADIHFAKRTILLRAETSKTYREYTIPMSGHLLESLLQLQIEAKALWNGASDFTQSQLFNIDLHKIRGNRCFKSLDDNQVSRFFTKLARLSEASLSCHRMRHRLATRLMELDATHARNVQALLGHANVATTLGYVSPSLKAIRAAIESVS